MRGSQSMGIESASRLHFRPILCLLGKYLKRSSHNNLDSSLAELQTTLTQVLPESQALYASGSQVLISAIISCLIFTSPLTCTLPIVLLLQAGCVKVSSALAEERTVVQTSHLVQHQPLTSYLAFNKVPFQNIRLFITRLFVTVRNQKHS